MSTGKLIHTRLKELEAELRYMRNELARMEKEIALMTDHHQALSILIAKQGDMEVISES